MQNGSPEDFRLQKRRNKMKLSNQAMGAIMMALQKSLLEQTDIVPTLESFDFKCDDTQKSRCSKPTQFQNSE